MKHLVLLLALALPASAAGYDADKFAETYCSIMRQGGSKNDAFLMAGITSTNKNVQPRMIQHQGKTIRSDELQAIQKILRLCPQYIQ
ncbi:MAG: hypothetical protein AAFX65_07430 [Cyanobacteria bacterium J06638_7]